MKKITYRITITIIIFLLINPLIQVNATEKPSSLKLHALSALLMDAESGRVLYEKNGYERLPMASTTKIMTCIIALENSSMDEIVTVSHYASTMPDVQLHIRKDEQYKMIDLLHSLMLESHNDVAVAIAEHIGGSVEGFATLMNQKARDLGAFDTNFVTSNGLDAEEHYTTAVDLGKITAYAINNEEFIKITNMTSYSFSEINGKRAYTVNNKNSFLNQMDGAIGVKTGFTGRAGYCFVGALEQDERKLISVVLGSGWPPHKNYKWNDTKFLMYYGLNNYYNKIIYANEKDIKKIYVEDGIYDYTNTYSEGLLSMLVREDEDIDYTYHIPDSITAPIEKGSIVGYVEISIDGNSYIKYPIKASDSILKITFPYCLEKVVERFLFMKILTPDS